ncbi:BTB/POZ protein [Camillea tinctor]|nr:BTB/POZ protein [Camillea tinctor]
MADTKPVVSLKPRLSRFVAVDEMLMISGRLADVEVKCRDRTWKLHRLILATRCPWFDKALNGEFKEARKGVVTIEEFYPEDIDLLIQYIYTGVFPTDNSPGNSTFDHAISMYVLCDHFLLSELCEDSLVCPEGVFY